MGFFFEIVPKYSIKNQWTNEDYYVILIIFLIGKSMFIELPDVWKYVILATIIIV